MNRELHKVYIIKFIQFLFFFISIIIAFLNREISTNWPFYLLLIGIMLGLFIPVKYRPNFSSIQPSIYFKDRSRRLESIIEMSIIIILLFLVTYLNVFWYNYNVKSLYTIHIMLNSPINQMSNSMSFSKVFLMVDKFQFPQNFKTQKTSLLKVKPIYIRVLLFFYANY